MDNRAVELLARVQRLSQALIGATLAYEEYNRVNSTGPGYDGSPPLVVDEPRPGDNPQLRPPRNAREHPLDLMMHRRQILPYQYTAGVLLRAHMELAIIGRPRASAIETIYVGGAQQELIDAGEPSERPVTFLPSNAKSTPSPRPLADKTLDAIQRVNDARQHVVSSGSIEHWSILEMIVRDRQTIKAIADRRSGRNRNRIGQHFRVALDVLADFYGLRGTAQTKVRHLQGNR